MYDEFLATFAENKTSLTPREIVHTPERVKRKVEGEHGDGHEVEDHPANHVPLASEDEYESLETIDGGKHDDGVSWDRLMLSRDQVDKVDDLYDLDQRE